MWHLSRDIKSEKEMVMRKSWGKILEAAGMARAKVLVQPQLALLKKQGPDQHVW